MNSNIYVLLLLLSVFISAISQILLKKSALETHSSWIKEYLNIKVISAYFLFFCAVFIDLIALKFVPVSFVPVIETGKTVMFSLITGFVFTYDYFFSVVDNSVYERNKCCYQYESGKYEQDKERDDYIILA